MDNTEKKLTELGLFISEILIYYITSNDEAFDVIDEIMNKVKETIDRRSHWIEVRDSYICDDCRCEADVNEDGRSILSSYCPNCGAKMY